MPDSDKEKGGEEGEEEVARVKRDFLALCAELNMDQVRFGPKGPIVSC